MEVFSYSELYTTLIGWKMAETVRMWLLAIGAPAYAYLVVVISMFSKVRGTDDNVERITSIFIARYGMFVISMGVISLFFFVGFSIEINERNVYFRPQPSIFANESVDEVTPATDNKSAASEALKGQITEVGIGKATSTKTEIPSGMYFPMIVVTTFNKLLVNFIPDMGDITAIRSNIAAARAFQPETAENIARFVNDCYLPAKERMDEYASIGGSAMLDKTGASDFYYTGIYGSIDDWPGSAAYFGACLYEKCDGALGVYGASLQAKEPVNGFAFDPVRDAKYNTGGQNQNGYPYCAEWWKQSIEPKILEEYENSPVAKIEANQDLMDKLTNTYPYLRDFFSDDNLKIKAMFENTLSAYQADPYYLHRKTPTINEAANDRIRAVGGQSNPALQAAGGVWAGMAGAAETGFDAILEGGRQLVVPITSKFKETGNDAAIMLLPLLQTFLLMILYIFCYVAVIASGFSFRVIGAFIGAYAGVRLANGIWSIAHWFDTLINQYIFNGVGSWADEANRGVFIYTFYYGGAALSMFLTSLYGWKGGSVLYNSVSSATQSISNISNDNAQASKTVVGAAANVGGGAIKGGIKGLSNRGRSTAT